MTDRPQRSPDGFMDARPEHAGLSKRRRQLFRGIAIGIPVVVGLLIAVVILIHREILVVSPETGWITFQQPPIYLEEPGHEMTGHRYRYDERLGWRNIPNWHATTWDRKLTINSRGLRDREYAYEKPASVRRILVLGDSFAWGYGVSDDEIFTERLETRLHHWQVINTGVSGWGTDQEYLFFKNEGIRYSPDVVVLAFFLFNDPENNVFSVQYGLSKPLFMDTRLEPANIPVPPPTSASVNTQSHADPIELTVAILLKISELCTERDCRFVVMKFGKYLELDPERMVEWEAQLLRQLAPHKEILYLDLDAEFLARGITKLDLLKGNDDGHWNAYGHQQTALILHEFLTAQKLLDR